jgi:hypothetical protein
METQRGIPQKSEMNRNASVLTLEPVLDSTNGSRVSAESTSALAKEVESKDRELDHCRQRIEALMSRNEELAKAAYGPARSSGSGTPGVKFLFVASVILALMNSASAESTVEALLCPREGKTELVRIPTSFNCTGLWPKRAEKPVSSVIDLFRPNTKLYRTDAVLCRIVTQKVKFSVSFWGDHRQERTEMSETVTSEECRQMREHRRQAICAIANTRRANVLYAMELLLSGLQKLKKLVASATLDASPGPI